MNETEDVSLGMHILEVEITTRCNLNCRHCYNRRYKPIDLPIKDFKRLYRFAQTNRAWTFTVSGGEALMHPEFNEILDFINSTPHDFRLVLQSNGILLKKLENREKIRAFDLVHISCDSVSDVRLFGEDNFKTAKILSDAGVNCYLFATVHRKNRDRIDEMVEMADKIQVPIGFNICIRTENVPEFFLFTREEFMQVEKKLNDLYKSGKILRYSSPLTSLWEETKKSKIGVHGGCSAGIGACVVDPKGEVFPCPFFRQSGGNIYKNSLRDIWLHSKLFEILRQRSKYQEPCQSCDKLAYCGGCRNRALNSSGSLTGPDPMCYQELIR